MHDTPDEKKLEPFAAFALKYGHEFDTKSPDGIARSFNQMLKDVQGKPEQHVLEQLGIRQCLEGVSVSLMIVRVVLLISARHHYFDAGNFRIGLGVKSKV